jgi:hypothetical protein
MYETQTARISLPVSGFVVVVVAELVDFLEVVGFVMVVTDEVPDVVCVVLSWVSVPESVSLLSSVTVLSGNTELLSEAAVSELWVVWEVSDLSEPEFETNQSDG